MQDQLVQHAIHMLTVMESLLALVIGGIPTVMRLMSPGMFPNLIRFCHHVHRAFPEVVDASSGAPSDSAVSPIPTIAATSPPIVSEKRTKAIGEDEIQGSNKPSRKLPLTIAHKHQERPANKQPVTEEKKKPAVPAFQAKLKKAAASADNGKDESEKKSPPKPEARKKPASDKKKSATTEAESSKKKPSARRKYHPNPEALKTVLKGEYEHLTPAIFIDAFRRLCAIRIRMNQVKDDCKETKKTDVGALTAAKKAMKDKKAWDAFTKKHAHDIADEEKRCIQEANAKLADFMKQEPRLKDTFNPLMDGNKDAIPRMWSCVELNHPLKKVQEAFFDELMQAIEDKVMAAHIKDIDLKYPDIKETKSRKRDRVQEKDDKEPADGKEAVDGKEAADVDFASESDEEEPVQPTKKPKKTKPDSTDAKDESKQEIEIVESQLNPADIAAHTAVPSNPSIVTTLTKKVTATANAPDAEKESSIVFNDKPYGLKFTNESTELQGHFTGMNKSCPDVGGYIIVDDKGGEWAVEIGEIEIVYGGEKISTKNALWGVFGFPTDRELVDVSDDGRTITGAICVDEMDLSAKERLCKLSSSLCPLLQQVVTADQTENTQADYPLLEVELDVGTDGTQCVHRIRHDDGSGKKEIYSASFLLRLKEYEP